MYIVRNPDSIRRPALQRSAKTTRAGPGPLLPGAELPASARARPRPAAESTLAGSRIARIVPPANTTKANRSDHSGRTWRPARRAARRWLRRPRRRGNPGVRLDEGESLGQQARNGGGPGDAVRLGGTRQPSAAGTARATRRPTAPASTQHRNARSAIVDADRPPPTVAEPVQERPDQRRDDRERQHRQAEEQRDLTAGLLGGRASEKNKMCRPRARLPSDRVGTPSWSSSAPASWRSSSRLRWTRPRVRNGSRSPAGASSRCPGPSSSGCAATPVYGVLRHHVHGVPAPRELPPDGRTARPC